MEIVGSGGTSNCRRRDGCHIKTCIPEQANCAHRELRDNDRIVTLNMIAAKVRRMDSVSRDLSFSAIRRRIYWHLCKNGVICHRVTHVAQNTRYDEGVKAGFVAFVNAVPKSGKYKASDIVNIDETNVHFDLVSGLTLDRPGEKTSGCATTVCSSRRTVLLGITMDREKLPPYIICKGANTPWSQIKKESKDMEARAKCGYPEGQFYTVQTKA
jgi:hypothetical protein